MKINREKKKERLEKVKANENVFNSLSSTNDSNSLSSCGSRLFASYQNVSVTLLPKSRPFACSVQPVFLWLVRDQSVWEDFS